MLCQLRLPYTVPIMNCTWRLDVPHNVYDLIPVDPFQRDYTELFESILNYDIHN